MNEKKAENIKLIRENDSLKEQITELKQIVDIWKEISESKEEQRKTVEKILNLVINDPSAARDLKATRANSNLKIVK